MNKTVLYNAKVYVEKGVYAGALYQEDGWIKAVGSTEEILELAADDAEKIDCGGRVVIPGFNDSHMHLINLGKQMMVPNLAKCKDLEDIIQTCRKYLDEHPNCKGLQCQAGSKGSGRKANADCPTRATWTASRPGSPWPSYGAASMPAP